MTKILFFDWDGTLCSKRVSEEANILRTQMFESSLNKKELIKLQHNNNNNHYGLVQSYIASYLGVDDLSSSYVKSIQANTFCTHYIHSITKEDLLFDVDELKQFKLKHNVKFVIVTSLWEGGIKLSLDKLGIKDIFDGVYGCSHDLSTTKQDNLEKAISEIEGEPLLMSGDRGEDVDAGIACNLKTLFCNYGHGSVEHANFSIEEPKDLFPMLEKIINDN
ncbi:MAG: HAD hydrolase-like protein [Nanoarchaeota archaeon]|nr:HAD hydrolase-like protein [Nanoarchaeota archaeon]MEC8339033.1 HAD hydrolase-like protein [Nanoarchaeota archaeon]